MQFIKNFFKHDQTVIGLCGLKKRNNSAKISVTESYKKTYMQNTEQNYLLF